MLVELLLVLLVGQLSADMNELPPCCKPEMTDDHLTVETVAMTTADLLRTALTAAADHHIT